ncbi:LOW QUALITY PROTEIN: probable calcium-binding protein CML47 [Abrus precatorius]|uniref:LOW QUALITY PROTEIN: probable calcium-binding protein CML47 n=1 Tax=Abrus precatorius TaxID=3816 RepID=A0A8B8M497_ABRPR|nr:LOW QUALITY PROTEIN: probable calcium-binding protein CML47 [Abrus precatorius]
MDHKLGKVNLSLLSLYLRILTWNIRIRCFFSFFFFFYFKFVFNYASKVFIVWTKIKINSKSKPIKQSLNYIQSGVQVSKENIVLVMAKLKMNVKWNEKEEFGIQEIEQLFKNDVILLEEAFDVFNQNKDGFIEASELQRILSCLGLEKDLMECQKMINAVDQNEDEIIAHNEFLSIIEQSFR